MEAARQQIRFTFGRRDARPMHGEYRFAWWLLPIDVVRATLFETALKRTG
jgi:hypothetical protein